MPVLIMNLETKAHHSTFNGNKEKNVCFNYQVTKKKFQLSARAHTDALDLNYHTAFLSGSAIYASTLPGKENDQLLFL